MPDGALQMSSGLRRSACVALMVLFSAVLATAQPPPFTDAPLVSGVTPVRAIHVTELRAAATQLYGALSVPHVAPAFADATLSPGGVPVRAQHIIELRNAVATLFALTGLAAPTYSNPGIAPGQAIRAADINELRAAFSLVWSWLHGGRLTVSAPPAAVAGTTFDVTVQALDGSNAPVPQYVGSATITSSDPAGVVTSPLHFVGGVAHFQASLRTSGPQTLTAIAQESVNASGTSGLVSVSPGHAANLVVSAESPRAAGQAFAVNVMARDAYGNLATGYSGSLVFTSDDPQASLPPSILVAISGSAVGVVTLRTAGDRLITVMDVSAPSIVGTASISVTPGGAASLAILSPDYYLAGVVSVVAVEARDLFGNVAYSYAGTIHITSSDALAILSSDTTAVNGTATFAVTLKTGGSQNLTATDTALPAMTATYTATVLTFSATAFTVTAPGTATAGVPFTVTVTARDAFGNLITSYAGTVHFTSTDANAVLPADVTLVNGTGTFANSVAFRTAGSQALTATDTSTGSLTGRTGGIAVAPGTVAALRVSAGSNAARFIPTSVVVTALDGFGNLVSSYTGAVHFSSNDALAALPANSTLVNGVGVFLVTFGTASLTTTVTATDTVSAGITGTSGAIVVLF